MAKHFLHLLGWPLAKAQSHLLSHNIVPTLQHTSSPKEPKEQSMQEGEFRVVHVRYAQDLSPILIVSFFPYGASII